MTAPRKPILTEEEIIAEGETYTVYKPCEDNFRQGFRLGARFALAAAENSMQRERECREKLVEALARAKEWMDEDGCDCGQDEPGTCALCICNAALAAAEEME